MSTPREELLNQLKAATLQRVGDGNFPLPSLPQAVLQALRILRQPEFELAELCRAVEPDAVMAARILRLANSVAFAATGGVTTLPHAMARIGSSNLESLLIEAASDQVFASQRTDINDAFRALWRHSLATGLVARDLARAHRHDNPWIPEAAYLAGLLHDIGKPIMAGFLVDAENRLVGSRVVHWLNPDEWLELIHTAHRAVGLLLAAEWELPNLVRRGIANATQYDDANPADVANYVRLANNVTKRDGVFIGRVDQEEVTTLVQKGIALLNLDEGLVNQAMAKAAADVARRV